ncbi:hypothetical protein C1J01_02110 [Nonomuraea aridisoli]|uniref:DUF397 domain-containing protein n=1 Tax=Nonomuraea aridisoli TaxID=2070368 RepID=A0A2W2F1K6_9ACTN|nr:hypothetical protein C1J01_02110 [Nonomuraea aridisoli]
MLSSRYVTTLTVAVEGSPTWSLAWLCRQAPLADGRVGLRDSEHPDLPAYVVSPSVWAAFIDGAKKGEFDF